jgi:hypothetical protein
MVTNRHNWRGSLVSGQQQCSRCRIRREVIEGPRGGLRWRYWSAYFRGEIACHSGGSAGVPLCDSALYGSVSKVAIV